MARKRGKARRGDELRQGPGLVALGLEIDPDQPVRARALFGRERRGIRHGQRAVGQDIADPHRPGPFPRDRGLARQRVLPRRIIQPKRERLVPAFADHRVEVQGADQHVRSGGRRAKRAVQHMTPQQHSSDERLDSLIDTYAPNAEGQSPECVAQVHTHWIEWAWRNGDKTVGEYIGDMPLYTPTMTYHEGDLNEIKLDLMRAKAKMKHNIEPDVVDAIHLAMRGFDMTKGVSFDKIGAVLGFDTINPLFVGEGDFI